MYQEWASLQTSIQEEATSHSVLHSYPEQVGKDVAGKIVRTLAQGLNLGTHNVEQSRLVTDKQVKWNMEVLCYGLSLPLSEHDTIKDCVFVYCEWLSALLHPKLCVPQPILDDPKPYCCQILQHLVNLFVPRQSADTELVKRQPVLCHKVLRTVETVAHESRLLDTHMWEALLKFLLAVNDALLAPPTVKDGIGDQLCERVVSVLFELWIRACSKSFPTPPLWKTFQEMCLTWRHHEALVKQWHRVNVAFTSRVLRYLYGPEYPTLPVPDEDTKLVPEFMDQDCVVQCWFRLLHTLGNPVDLSRPQVVSNTSTFMHMALTCEPVIEPYQHECLHILPNIFHKAMKGISDLVDAFLGTNYMNKPYSQPSSGQSSSMAALSAGTPPHARRKGALSMITPKASSRSGTSKGSGATATPMGSPTQLKQPTKISLASGRPTVDSVLHLFGAWLFEAAITGVKVYGAHASSAEDTAILGPNLYQSGRAEACGTLCRIFCSHKTGEVIRPVYLSRFYTALHYGLTDQEQSEGEVLANIIINATDLLRVDLEGALVLVPSLLQALESILTELTPKFKYDLIPAVELRRSSIHLLLSMLSLPLLYKDSPIHGMLEKFSTNVLFSSLKFSMVDLLLKAILMETDSQNTQMLLGGLMLCVQDLALYELADSVVEQITDDPSGNSPTKPTGSVDSAQSLFDHATSLVCHRLMVSWKSDLNIALAAIEVLSSLAKLRLRRASPLMCKRTVIWICELITYQCSRPAPFHSKDLHSMIVAAFHCLTLWFVEHPYLMQDKECLTCVLEVVELGISGSKSQNRASDVPKLKGEKELKPVSQRVKEAAECLLACIMDHVGSFPPPCGPESLCSLLDEEALLRISKDGVLEQGSLFKYFVLDGTTVLGLLEQPLGNDQDPLPTVIAVIRGPFGRHVWSMQLRHMPRSKKVSSKALLAEPRRPHPGDSIGVAREGATHNFPPLVETATLVQSDQSIPKLETTLDEQAFELMRLDDLIRRQGRTEEGVVMPAQQAKRGISYPDPDTECRAPSVCHDFQTARLFLSHYSFLSLEAVKDPHNSVAPPALVMLDGSQAGFHDDMQQLDLVPSRSTDTVFLFYVKAGQKMPFEILYNVQSKETVSAEFQELLMSLGWPVDVRKHSGWTGQVATSWRVDTSDDDEPLSGDTGGSIFDGRRRVLYWSDVLTEVAFVVPSPETYHPAIRRASFDTSSALPDQEETGQVLRRQRSNTESVIPDHPSYATSQIDSTGLPTGLKDNPMVPLYIRAKRESSQSSVGSSDVNRPQRLAGMGPVHPPKSLSLDLEDKVPPYGNRSVDSSITPTEGFGQRFSRAPRASQSHIGCDTKVYVVWLESFEDHENFPEGDFVQTTMTGLETQSSSSNMYRLHERQIYVIFIHPLRNGLFRIKVKGQPHSKVSTAVPLVDGMVVSRRVLGTLVRQTAINICKRRRLENEVYQPPHVRRKLKIREMVDKHRNKLIEPEFYTALFQ